jgi:single-strand DNA-binding protein
VTSINRVVLVGRLTRDMELKTTPNGTAVGKFSIAVNTSYKSGEEWKEEAHFFNVVLWGKRAEALAKYLTKGMEVGIDGSLRQNRWKTDDGQDRSVVEINAENVNLLRGTAQGKTEQKEPDQKQQDFKDDIPF